MKYIVHGFNDADASKILRNCCAAMAPGTKLLLIQRVLKSSNEPDPGKFMDLQMLVVAPGAASEPKRTTARYLMKLASRCSE